MLIELFGKNFGSFRDEFRLSLLATDIDPGDQRGIVEVPLEGEDEPLRLLRCAAIYGPNASGKSNLLRAAQVLGNLIRYSAGMASDALLEPYEPFLLDRATANAPVELGVVAVIDRRIYRYSIGFVPEAVDHEELVDLSRDTVLFARHKQDVSGEWISNERFRLIAAAFRPNSLLLSLTDALAPALAGTTAPSIRRLLTYQTSTESTDGDSIVRRVAQRVEQEETFRAWLLRWLRDADTGIVDVATTEARSRTPYLPPRVVAVWIDPSGELPPRELKLSHVAEDGSSIPMPFSAESFGTQKLVQLAPLLYSLTHGEQPSACFADEFDASIHPTLFAGILRHFNCEIEPSAVRGQLIFTAHETSLIDAEARDAVLRRDQVYLTDKDASGASRLYSIGEFRERNNVNLRKRYLEGRYGAIPSIGGFQK